MKHLDETTILACRDGEPVGPEARRHLDACAACRAELGAATERAEAVARTLAALDGPIEATAAKAGVRARLGSTRPPDRGWGGRHLGRAAALLLVTAGAAAALPWSPVRTFLRPAPESATEVEQASAAPVSTTTGAARLPAESGIAVAVPDGFIQVVVRGALPGTDLLVAWTDQDAARLSAPTGSRFTYAAGRIEVDAARGAIRLELPRVAERVSIEVDGRLYLSGSTGALEVLGPAVERDDDGIRFKVEGP